MVLVHQNSQQNTKQTVTHMVHNMQIRCEKNPHILLQYAVRAGMG